MPEGLFVFATGWVVMLLAVVIAAMIGARSAMTKVLMLDTVTLMLATLLILYSDSLNSPYYVDGALALALLSFIGTIAAAHYHGDRRVF
ncbi:MAG: monovalent cation/H+ antiporter complex subunit F [Thermomicrobiales bacterium]